MISGTKGEILLRLSGSLRHAEVPRALLVSLEDFAADPEAVLERIAGAFPESPVIVRSSAEGEDSRGRTLAGAFLSVGNISSDDKEALREAIRRVEESYRKSPEASGRHVLVQRYLDGADVVGVMFTRDPRGGGPYDVINFASASERTDTVTAGKDGDLLVVAHGSRIEGWPADLVALGRELESVCEEPSVDIEFAVSDGRLNLLQVRPLQTSISADEGLDQRVRAEIDALSRAFADWCQPKPHLYGSRTILGVMPDWNPAEMIGTEPRPLAYSLYRRLITDSAWRDARSSLGYADPYPEALMKNLCGHPYIDCRVSFHSFMPANLDPDISHRLVDACLDILEAHPDRHDKVEFEVVPTCATLNFHREARELLKEGLSIQDIETIRASYVALTDRMIRRGLDTLSEQLDTVSRLRSRREKILAAHLPPLERVRLLLADATRFGVFPFAILARFAFVGASFLRSLQEEEILTSDERHSFIVGIDTVAGQLVTDMERLYRGGLSTEEFMARFGHLRPGTYDLRIPRYDQAPERYLSGSAPPLRDSLKTRAFRPGWRRAAEQGIHRAGFTFSADELLAFVRESIRAREYAKFEFTHNISDALESIAEWGESVGLDREALSFLDVDLLTGDRDDGFSLSELVAYRREHYRLTRALRIPPLITSEKDFHSFCLSAARPTFISCGCVTAPPLRLLAEQERVEVEGCAVLIESADPGYDWIFSRRPAALVTKYGGANSHMAIRAAEFSLPAAIGCGEMLFERLERARMICLDAEAGVVRPVEL